MTFTLSSAALAAPVRRLVAGVAAPILAFAAPLPAAATPLPAPIVHGDAFFNVGSPPQAIDTFGTLIHSAPTHGTLVFSSTGTPSPALTATASLDPVGTGSGTVSGFLRYTFEILGDDCLGAEGCVPVFAFAAGRVAGYADPGPFNGFESIARWSLRNTSEIILVGDSLHISGAGGESDVQGFAETHSLMLRTNTEYRVVMEVLARAGGLEAGALSVAEAFVDPLFSFGAGVDPGRYAFHFADGIGNSPPVAGVPAPGGLALVMVGLLAMAVRRSRLNDGWDVRAGAPASTSGACQG